MQSQLFTPKQGQNIKCCPAASILKPLAFLQLAFILLVLADGTAGCSRNVEPGDRSYPVLNPTPKQTIAIEGEVPQNWELHLLVEYASRAADNRMLSTGCTYYTSVVEGAVQPYSISREIPITRDRTSFKGTFAVDQFKEGSCGWHASALSYLIGTRDGTPLAQGRLAGNEFDGCPPGGCADFRTREDLWCMDSPSSDSRAWVNGARLDCESWGDTKDSPLGYIPRIRKGVNLAVMIYSTTSALTFVFHDLAVESEAWKRRADNY
jgi:hypothetical protein